MTTNLRYKHIEEYGLYQFHRGWLQEVFIVAGGHVGNEDISNFAKLWSDQIPPPTPFCLSGLFTAMYTEYQRRLVRAGRLLQEEENVQTQPFTFANLLWSPNANFRSQLLKGLEAQVYMETVEAIDYDKNSMPEQAKRQFTSSGQRDLRGTLR